MRQLTGPGKSGNWKEFSKLPVRQLTFPFFLYLIERISKLPVRQLTVITLIVTAITISKLPVRQLTKKLPGVRYRAISKLPVRQLTVALYHTNADYSYYYGGLAPNTQIFSPVFQSLYFTCFSHWQNILVKIPELLLEH